MTHPVWQSYSFAERSGPADSVPKYGPLRKEYSICTQPGKKSPSLSTGVPLLCDRLAFLLGGAKDDMTLK